MSKFITFEGTEGVGKSTQIERLEKFLKSQNIKTFVTREPGGTLLGEKIREILLDKNLTDIDPCAELLLMFAARAQHLEKVIYPKIKNNTWVLCDRFTDASYAYQGGGRGVSFEHIHNLETFVHKNFKPDITFLLTGDVKKGLQRVSTRGEKDRFEKEKLEFYEHVNNAYLELAKVDTNRFVKINADQSIDKVADDIEQTMKKQFPELTK